jgi:hypothetical protein
MKAESYVLKRVNIAVYSSTSSGNRSSPNVMKLGSTYSEKAINS